MQTLTKRLTLDWWKLYLDSCASFHTFFVKEFLMNISEGTGAMNGNCNAGTTIMTKRGYYRRLRVWLNENGIANLISIPKLEADGYVVKTNTNGEWQVVTPEGETIPFQRDKGMCVGMPYIDLRYFKQGLVLIETVRNNMGRFTHEEIQGAKLARQTQGRVGNPPDRVFKKLIGTNDL